MASRNFTTIARKLALGDINFNTDVFYALLINDTAIPSETQLDTWSFRSDVSIEHAIGDYTEGGFLCSSTVEAVVDEVNDNVEITIIPNVGNGNPVFTLSTISSKGAIIFRQVGGDMLTPSSDDLICFVDFNGTIASSVGDFNVTFNTPIQINVGA